jgi:hypothetical protein
MAVIDPDPGHPTQAVRASESPGLPQFPRPARGEGHVWKLEGRGEVCGRQGVIAILHAFTYGDELTNIEIARLTGLPESTSHRLLSQLVLGGMLERTAHRQYRIRPKVRAIAAAGSVSAMGSL